MDEKEITTQTDQEHWDSLCKDMAKLPAVEDRSGQEPSQQERDIQQAGTLQAGGCPDCHDKNGLVNGEDCTNIMHDRLMHLAAAMYQIAGANSMPIRIMDCLSEIQNGGWSDPDKMLPYAPEENGVDWDTFDIDGNKLAKPPISATGEVARSLAHTVANLSAKLADKCYGLAAWRSLSVTAVAAENLSVAEYAASMERQLAELRAENEKEIARWQDTIYQYLREECGDFIDGGGCDSGDPLDFTMSEISQGFTYLKDSLAKLDKYADEAEANRAAAESALSQAQAKLERAMDLVRHQRSELLLAGLIEKAEYTALAADTDNGTRVARLESYDDMRNKLEKAQAKVEELTEWRDSVSTAIQTIPEFKDGAWGGDKNGWGFHYEMVQYCRRQRAKAESTLQQLREGLEKPLSMFDGYITPQSTASNYIADHHKVYRKADVDAWIAGMLEKAK